MLEGVFCKRVNASLSEVEKAKISVEAELLRVRTDLVAARKSYLEQESALKAALDNSEKSKKDLLKQITDDSTVITTLEMQLKELQDLVTQLNSSQINGMALLPEEAKAVATLYWNKYKEADVLYNGRYLGADKRMYELDVKVFCLEGQNDFNLKNLVKSAKGYVVDIMKDEGVSFHKACDKAVMRVTNIASVNYNFDSTTWGSNEFWQFATETNAYRKGDCDDYATLRHVLCRIAGVPEPLLRNVAGLTFGGEGHCTNYYLASDLKFHHINSTSNFNSNFDATTAPLTGDSSDKLGIQYPWFSFTESKAWYELTTQAQKNAQRGEQLKRFRIKPR